MTPAEFIIVQKQQQSIISKASRVIADARARAEKCKSPKNLRPVKPEEIKPGMVLWHKRSKQNGGDYWNIVFKYKWTATHCDYYIADDGDAYSVHGAFVEE